MLVFVVVVVVVNFLFLWVFKEYISILRGNPFYFFIFLILFYF